MTEILVGLDEHPGAQDAALDSLLGRLRGGGCAMTRVVIAGSGVAAVEAVLALRALAGRGFEIDLLAPEHALVDRPASVTTPFGLGAPPPLDLHELAARYAVRLVEGELAGVDPARGWPGSRAATRCSTTTCWSRSARGRRPPCPGR